MAETEVTTPDWFDSTDPAVWAREFMKQFDVVRNDGAPIDEFGNLVGWFANAMGAEERRMQDQTLVHIASQVHTVAMEHGWWEDGRRFDGVIALIHSEASEALEEWRDQHDPWEHYYKLTTNPGSIYSNDVSDAIETFKEHGMAGLSEKQSAKLFLMGVLKPEGIPSELADIIIRVLDAVVFYDIHIMKALREKMLYNQGRKFRHGGKRS